MGHLTTRHSLGITILLVLLGTSSCKQPAPKVVAEPPAVDSLAAQLSHTEQDWELIDSIWIDEVLQQTLTLAGQHLGEDSFFYHEYETYSDSGGYNMRVTMKLGRQLAKDQQHLIVHRYGPNDVHIDIFTVMDGGFEKVLSLKEWSLTYTGDTIMDVDGDRVNDFVVNWYGSTGCCLKAFADVYLQRPRTGTFSEKYEFVNPTFSPREKVVRGVCYGHMGDTEMYKYRWNGDKVDTLEYIYFEKNDQGKRTGKVIRADQRSVDISSRVAKLKSVPLEYETIEGYSWFLGTREQEADN